MNTKVNVLPSGVEFEVYELTGKQQKILTQNTGGMQDRLDKMLASVLARVGDKSKIDEEFVQSMRSQDRRFALLTARRFSMEGTEYENKFDLDYEYKSETEGIKKSFPLTVDISEFEVRGYQKPKIIKKEEGLELSYEPVDYSNYDEVINDSQYEVFLPKSGKKCLLSYRTGKHEKAASLVSKKERSSHTVLEMSNPRLVEDNDVPIKADLDKMPLYDLGLLRKVIKNCEARVDTEIMFEHPEADLKGPGEKDVIIDILSEPAFYFPSGVI